MWCLCVHARVCVGGWGEGVCVCVCLCAPIVQGPSSTPLHLIHTTDFAASKATPPAAIHTVENPQPQPQSMSSLCSISSQPTRASRSIRNSAHVCARVCVHIHSYMWVCGPSDTTHPQKQQHSLGTHCLSCAPSPPSTPPSGG